VRFGNPGGNWSFHRDFCFLHAPHDIIYDIMNPKKLAKLRWKLESFRRRGGIKSQELEDLAKAMGRRRHPRRGKEPTWVSDVVPNSRPLSIPSHSRDLNKITAGSILDRLEEDLDRPEEIYGDG
jgi:hypothetical protein